MIDKSLRIHFSIIMGALTIIFILLARNIAQEFTAPSHTGPVHEQCARCHNPDSLATHP